MDDEWITPREFHQTDGLGDWRLVAGGACAYFRTGSFEVRVAAAIAAGGRLVTDANAPYGWVLADAEGNEACVATAGWTGPLP